MWSTWSVFVNYNIPSNNRELQLLLVSYLELSYYNIPSNNRELQPGDGEMFVDTDYNIPSNNRELQRTYDIWTTL